MRLITAFILSLFLACAGPVSAAPAPKPLKFYRPSNTGVPLIELQTFDKAAVEGFVNKFRELDAEQTPDEQKKRGEVWVRIHSYGGSVSGGEDIIHALEGAKSLVVCVADFRAMSMGFEVLESPGCDFRLMTPRAQLMAHEVQSSGVGGGPGDIADVLVHLQQLSDAGLAQAAKRMGISMEFMRSKTTRKMWFLDADEARRYNAIDGFVEPRLVPAATPFEIKKESLFDLFGG